MVAKSNTVVRVKLLIMLVFGILLAAAFWQTDPSSGGRATAQSATPTPPPAAPAQQVQASPAPAAAPTPEAPRLEGCLKCHNNIEPMHKYSTTGDVYETLKDGRIALPVQHEEALIQHDILSAFARAGEYELSARLAEQVRGAVDHLLDLHRHT